MAEKVRKTRLLWSVSPFGRGEATWHNREHSIANGNLFLPSSSSAAVRAVLVLYFEKGACAIYCNLSCRAHTNARSNFSRMSPDAGQPCIPGVYFETRFGEVNKTRCALERRAAASSSSSGGGSSNSNSEVRRREARYTRRIYVLILDFMTVERNVNLNQINRTRLTRRQTSGLSNVIRRFNLSTE